MNSNLKEDEHSLPAVFVLWCVYSEEKGGFKWSVSESNRVAGTIHWKQDQRQIFQPSVGFICVWKVISRMILVGG